MKQLSLIQDDGRCPTCGPYCDDTCRGYCGCEACADAWGEHDEPVYGLEFLQAVQCPHCGRPEVHGHQPDCIVIGGERDDMKRHKAKLRQDIKEAQAKAARLKERLEAME